MKKFLSIVLAAVMMVSVLTACGGSTGTQDSPPASPPTSNDGGGTGSTTVEPPPMTTEPITLRYMAWDLGPADDNDGKGNVERQLLQAFMDKYEHITVEIVTVPLNADGTDGNYGDYLVTLAAQQNLPDVFMWTSVPDTVARGWLYNLSDYALNDQEFLNVTGAMRDGTKVNGNVYAVPYAMFMQGMAINFDIFDELNVPYLPFSYTLDELRQAMADTSSGTYRGSDNLNIQDWGAFVLSNDLGWFAFDGSGYKFTRPEFAQAVDFFRDLVERGHTGHGGFVEPWAPEGVWPWGDGYIALQLEATWAINDFVNGARPFKADLMPLPNQKGILIPDFIFVGANTEHPREAYELAKWMSFGRDGQLKRLEIIPITPGAGYKGVPMMAGSIPEVDEFFLDNYRSLENFLRMYELLSTHPQNFIMEPFKTLPGYVQSRFYADTGVIATIDGEERSLAIGQLMDSILKGERQLADYAAEMERVVTAEFENAKAMLAGY